jgi:hypothetical protein
MNALVDTVQPGTSRGRADWDLAQFVVGRTGFEDRCVRVEMSTVRTPTICLRTLIWQTGVGSAGAPTCRSMPVSCRTLAMCRGFERYNRQVRHAPKPRFPCSSLYLDVKRSVWRGTCPQGTHTFDIWLPT